MLKDNLIMLRKLNGLSHEAVAEKLNISRQAYAKWERGETIPDIERCAKLAQLYGVSIDSLIKEESTGTMVVPPAPIGKNIWGSVTVNDRGQIVIPKEARDKFNIKNGTRLIVISDENGIALLHADEFEDKLRKLMEQTLKETN